MKEIIEAYVYAVLVLIFLIGVYVLIKITLNI